MREPPSPTLFPYTTLFRSQVYTVVADGASNDVFGMGAYRLDIRSEEHTSELQSHSDLVCRLLLEKKNQATAAPLETVVAVRRTAAALYRPSYVESSQQLTW